MFYCFNVGADWETEDMLNIIPLNILPAGNI